jgi:hypothetical protein
MAEHTPNRFRISWDGGAYHVSIPNYDGGEVVDAALFDEAVEIITGLIVLERGSGEKALAFLQRYNAAVGTTLKP